MFDLFAHTHLLAVAGSRAHGLSGPDSDVDLKGVCVPPRRSFFGIGPPFAQIDDSERMGVFAGCLTTEEAAVVAQTKLEGSVFGLQKLARLAVDSNPNILEGLFCRDAEVRHATPVGEALREGAHRFLSRRARHAFGGYAAAQLKRIKNHRQWLMKPPTEAPTRAGFGLPDNPVVPKAQLEAAESAVRKRIDGWEVDFTGVPASTVIDVRGRMAQVLGEIGVGAEEKWFAATRWVGLDDNLVELMARERRYKRARTEWRQYQSWKRNRNPARAALEARFGYDTKHGAHLVRLLSMAREIIEDGEVHVWRADRDGDQLRAIRAGEWSFDALLEWAEAQNATLDAALATSPLPERADHVAIDTWIIELTEQAFQMERDASRA